MKKPPTEAEIRAAAIFRQTPKSDLLRLQEKRPEFYEMIQEELMRRIELNAAHALAGSNHS